MGISKNNIDEIFLDKTVEVISKKIGLKKLFTEKGLVIRIDFGNSITLILDKKYPNSPTSQSIIPFAGYDSGIFEIKSGWRTMYRNDHVLTAYDIGEPKEDLSELDYIASQGIFF